MALASKKTKTNAVFLLKDYEDWPKWIRILETNFRTNSEVNQHAGYAVGSETKANYTDRLEMNPVVEGGSFIGAGKALVTENLRRSKLLERFNVCCGVMGAEIHLYIDEGLMANVKNTDLAKASNVDLWDPQVILPIVTAYLKSITDPELAGLSAREKLKRVKMSRTESLSDYQTRFQDMKATCLYLQSDKPPQDCGAAFMRGLSPALTDIANIVKGRIPALITKEVDFIYYELVRQKEATAAEDQHQAHGEDNRPGSQEELIASLKAQLAAAKQDPREQQSANLKAQITNQNKKKAMPLDKWCSKCEMKNHNTHECTRGDKLGNKCLHCKQPGHWKNKCPQLEREHLERKQNGGKS
jgi:hypothetical protein